MHAQWMSLSSLDDYLAKAINFQNVPITWDLVILFLEIYPTDTFHAAKRTHSAGVPTLCCVVLRLSCFILF